MIETQPLDICTEGLYSSYSYGYGMEQQRQLIDFQIPFELGGGNSDRVSAVPSLIQGAEYNCVICKKPFIKIFKRRKTCGDKNCQYEYYKKINREYQRKIREYSTNTLKKEKRGILEECQRLYDKCIPICKITEMMSVSYYLIRKNITYKTLYKNCKYCGQIFNNQNNIYGFYKKTICDSKECNLEYFREKKRDNPEYYRLKYKRNYNPKAKEEYLERLKISNPKKYQEWEQKRKKWSKEYSPINVKNRRKKENQRRKEIGLPLIGENYKRENELLKYVKKTFPNIEILHRKRIVPIDKDKRKNLELDIYIPSMRLAFEYMGEQHYSNKNYRNLLKYFAKINPDRVSRSFEDLQYNDRIKKKICKLIGIKLIRIKYNEKLSEDLVKEKCQMVEINA